MKDAKGHGSDARGGDQGAAHQNGVDQLGRNHWFDAAPLDPYVYHGTDTDHLPGIQKEGLQAFLGNYFATDPKLAMQYGYRPNLHHAADSRTRPGVLLRVRKEDVDPEQWARRNGYRREDFWRGPPSIPPEKIEVRQRGTWKKLGN